MCASLSEVLKQSIVVENRAGAGGNLGINVVAKSHPDGYTIGFATNGPLAGNVAMFKDMPYDPAKDLASIARLGFVANVVSVHPSMPVKTLEELIALLKVNPDTYSFSSGGNGTTSHLSGEYLKALAGVRMTHIPYKGDGPALIATIGGQVPISIASIAASAPYVESGKLRALAVTSRDRSPVLPDVPTVAASGFPDYEFAAWYGLVAAAATPANVIRQLGDACLQVINSPRMVQRFSSLGGAVAPMGPDEFGAYMKAEIPRMTKIIHQVGASVN
ncbi:Bug family tripartite tricarboxylate transporter substrate binding protein [Achromobacter aegrifaciens]